jgi:hypothetical protein
MNLVQNGTPTLPTWIDILLLDGYLRVSGPKDDSSLTKSLSNIKNGSTWIGDAGTPDIEGWDRIFSVQRDGRIDPGAFV